MGKRRSAKRRVWIGETKAWTVIQTLVDGEGVEMNTLINLVLVV
jgi:hypothetical protein